MAGEDNITQIYNTDKLQVLAKDTQFVDSTSVNIFFEFDAGLRGNALVAKGHYTEEFTIPSVSGAGAYTMPPIGNLVLYYKLDESSGLVATDEQGIYNGTLVNTEDADWQSGQTNNGLYLGGTDERVDVNDDLESVFQSPFSISFWLKPTDGRPDASGQYILGTADSGGNGRMRIQLDSNGAVGGVWGVSGGAGQATTGTITSVFDDGAQSNFSHFVFIVNESGGEVTVYMYKDTVLTSITWGGNPITQSMSSYNNSTRNLWIGYYNDGTHGTYPTWHLDGMIDEVRIYNIALTTDQIAALYNNDV